MKGFGSALRSGLQHLGIVAIAMGSLPGVAIAHGAHIQARTATAMEIQATYDSGEPLAEATVQVFAPDDPQTPVYTGLTDADGKFVFVPTAPGNWEVSVRQAGHGDIAVVPVESEGAIASTFTNDAGLSLLQRGIVAGAVTWGCVGTALFFGRRGKQ
ncbi:carboxypeptidase-like regulatory domain-containing protein [Leptolyngbya iicbica]|uniref:Carboxypeptidase regulatory-like domain-containing protein n=2 Tax=Cyanophyceae TaxID=3028117 RepID=A0A4Q7EG01_9CYAN|nr:carboxypeptidase-like regulatory domain-containing protein [Leptolyngbya sp. LK]RZM81878.1 carboxypeptidase regulatory-like domain-containing protein [Leptolyngbya sp. LK]